MNPRIAKLGPWIVACLFLAAANGPVHEWAIDRFIRPNYEVPGFPLQERTVGLNVLYVFDILEARRRPDTRYFFLVGDSSVGSGMMDPTTMLPTHLERLLRQEYGDDVEVVLLSYPGLLIEDALLFVAEALARDPEMVYFAVNPRIFADTSSEEQRARGLSGRVAGLAFAREGWRDLPWSYPFRRFSLERLASAWVAGAWHVVADSSAIRKDLNRSCERGKARMPQFLSYACNRLFPLPEYVPALPPAVKPSLGYVYRNADFHFEPGPTEAFQLLLQRCRDSGRCLLYQTPLNLDAPGCRRYFEPGLIDRYLSFLEASGFRDAEAVDHTGDLEPERFMNERGGGCDVLHPDREGRAKVAEMLMEDTRAVLSRRGEGTR